MLRIRGQQKSGVISQVRYAKRKNWLRRYPIPVPSQRRDCVSRRQKYCWLGRNNCGLQGLVDGYEKGFERNRILIHRSVQPIVASSPKVSNDIWIKQAGDNIFELAPELWSRSQRELLLTGLVLALAFNSLPESSLGYSFLVWISLSSCSGSQPRISVLILVNALAPHYSLAWWVKGNVSRIGRKWQRLFRDTKSGANMISHRFFSNCSNRTLWVEESM